MAYLLVSRCFKDVITLHYPFYWTQPTVCLFSSNKKSRLIEMAPAYGTQCSSHEKLYSCHSVAVVTDPFCLQDFGDSVDQEQDLKLYCSHSCCVCVCACTVPGAEYVRSVVCHTLVPNLWPASSWPPLQHETCAQLHTHRFFIRK